MKSLGAVIVAVAAGAFASFINASARLIDATQKVATKLGLTATALIGLRKAAVQTGVGTQTLDMALQRMARRMSEAAKGTGEAKAALKELGLDAIKLNSLTVDKQFLAVADAMAMIPNQADRVRLGFKIFDSEGVALINTLRIGSKRIEEFAAKAEELGTTFTPEEAEKVEGFRNAIDDLFDAFKGLGNSILIELATPLTEVVKLLTAFVTGAREAVKLIGKLPGFLFSDRGGTGGRNIGEKILSIQEAAKKRRDEATIKAFTPEDTFKQLGDSAGATGLVGTFKILAESTRDTEENMARLALHTKQAAVEAKKLKAIRKFLADRKAERLSKERAKQFKLDDEGRAIKKSLRSPAEVFADERANLDKLFLVGSIGMETFRGRLAQLKDEFKDANGFNALMERGAELTRRFRTPMEVFKDRMKELRNQFRNNAISTRIYDLAVKENLQSLEDATNELNGMGDDVFAGAFKEIDDTLVALGGGPKTKKQMTEETNSAKILKETEKQTKILKNGVVGVLGK